ncbi:transcriptional regulator [[Clostridium] sordellii]|uniref:response regulator transcription factor n=1 Tax=Paraclostridium sordellii TaxID=1505 RepID=UPI0005DE4448|nr:response regulator transcription factor [Paeniclostridium sordellii]MDU6112896.1 response regulator transcription factor [Paeniclostridium sordellii]CEN88396.1 transcriptional regulator [[Clostridium] sordellii] [Paeniclostridium sordellii]CEO08076.1 transcriptional regulator [[Clostridium] sordellii] [Paeniclostridium sordellii]CEQ12374.1 transcriptional regulator [[Clostridium] sordellii] [Paeniclostridium sordellii]
MSSILLIEDDFKLKEYISEYLKVYDYEVIQIDNFEDIMGTVKKVNPSLILLDINLPKFDGFYFLKLIRNNYKIPVIILSARSDEGEQIRGMELGADDYVTKPFSIGILIAKINALLRRTNEYISKDNQNKELNEEKKGDLELINNGMKLKYKGQIIELTKNEYGILNLFFSNVGNVITREEILEELWDDTTFVDDNTLTVNMTRVKKKLSELGINNVIITKRGVGYVFNGINN